MAGRIEWVRPGVDAEDALVATIQRAQGDDPLAPVTVAVRSPVVALDLRRRLADRGAFAGSRFLPVSRLIELLGAPEAGAAVVGGRPLSSTALGAAVRVSLGRAPGILAGVAEHPATEESLVATYRMLRPLSDDERARLKSMSERAHDVVAIVDGARTLVAGSRYDLEDLTLAAAAGLEAGGVDLEAVGHVVVHLPDPLPRSQVRLLGALAAQGDVTVLAGRLGDAAGDRASEKLVADLERAGFTLQRRAATGTGLAEPPRVHEAIGAPDFEEEVRVAVRLLAAHAEAGGQLGRTALAVPGSMVGRSYVAVIDELFKAAGIPWTGPATGSLAESPAGRLVLDLIELISDAERPFDRTAVIRWLSLPALSSAAPLARGLSFASADGSTRVPVGAFDRCSREAGVVSGHKEWGSRVTGYRRRAEERAAASGSASKARAAQVAADLLKLVDRLHVRAESLRTVADWAGVQAWAVSLAEFILPSDDERDRLVDALSTLGELADLEPLAASGTDPAATELRSRQLSAAFAGALASPTGSRGRFGTGPVVGRISALAGIRCDLLIVLGCREGVLPARTPDDPLVTELERKTVHALAELERVEQRDRRTTLMLLAGAERSVATYPRVDRGASRPAYPSRWLAGDLFTGQIGELASFPGALEAVADGRYSPADHFDLELATLARGVAAGRRVGSAVAGTLDDVGRRLSAERARFGDGLSRFGGLAGPPPANSEDVFDQIVSATRVEALAACPLKFMFDRVLHVEILEAPDRLDSIDAMTRGTLIHEVLERFVEETALGRDPFTPFDANDFARLREIADEECDRAEALGKTGKPLYWQMERAQIVADLERFVELESERIMECGGRPVETEYEFGGESAGPVVIDLGGSELKFQGKIDRIDVEPSGVVRVIDYKSGSSKYFAGIETDPLERGLHLQLPVYAKAAAAHIAGTGGEVREVVAEYRFCSAAGGFDTKRVELTEKLDKELTDTLSVLAGTIRQGTFPPRPGSPDDFRPKNCSHCDYQTICRLDRFSLWDRAAGDPAMTEYVTLVEPASAPAEEPIGSEDSP